MKFDTYDCVVELTQELLRINTVDPPGNETRAATLIGRYLSLAGVRYESFEIAPGRSCLVATIPGNGSQGRLVYSGHFDTIDVQPEQWSVDPFGGAVKDGKMFGRGAADMKSGVAAMTVAAMDLQRSAGTLDCDLVFVFSAEENTSELGAKQLLQRGYLDGASGLIVGEPTSNKVLIGEKGALWLHAEARGEYGHNAFSEGRTGDRGNAIIRLAEFIGKARNVDLGAPTNRYLGRSTSNFAMVRGGEAFPLIPASAGVDIDVRTLPGQQSQTVLEAYRAVAGPYVTVTIVDDKPAVETADDDPFVLTCLAAAKRAGVDRPGPEGVGYYSDASVFVPEVGMPMIIFGPGDIGASGMVDEFVDLGNLRQAVDAYVNMAVGWSQTSHGRIRTFQTTKKEVNHE